MKKRLLSAALALAMVLTLLPVSAFAAANITYVDGDLASYVNPNNANDTGVGKTVKLSVGYDYTKNLGPGEWYWEGPNVNNVITIYKATTGFVNGAGTNSTITSGAWYPDVDSYTTSTRTTLPASITLLGTITVDDTQQQYFPTSFTVDLNGNTLALPTDLTNAGAKGDSPMTSLTLKNTSSTAVTLDDISTGRKTFNSSTSRVPGALNLTIDNVTVGAINLKGRANTVTLQNKAAATSITMDGESVTAYDKDGNVKTTAWAAQKVILTGVSNGGAISITNADSSSVSVTDSTTADISVTGNDGTITVAGRSTTGKITVGSRTKSGNSAIPKVTVNGGTVAGIERDDTGSTAGSSFTISRVNYNINITAPIVTTNGSVSVTTATTGDITVEAGSLSVSGGSTIGGDVTLGNSGTTDLSISGTGNSFAKIAVPAGKGGNLTINSWPTGRDNYFGALDLKNYASKGVKGGTFAATFGTEAGKYANIDWFDMANLQFIVPVKNSSPAKVALYGKTELTKAISDIAATTPADKTNPIIVLGQGEAANKSILQLNFGSNPWAYIQYNDTTGLLLPTRINNTEVTKWIVDNGNAATNPSGVTAGTEFDPNKEEGIPALGNGDTKPLILTSTNASPSAVVTKIINVTMPSSTTVENSNVSVKLDGNNIVLSGAITVGAGGYADFKVNLITDVIQSTTGAPLVMEDVIINYNVNTKKATFSGIGTSLDAYGAIVQGGELILNRGTGAHYTVSANLSVSASSLELYAPNTGSAIVATLGGSLSNWTPKAKEELITQLENGTFKFLDTGDSGESNRAMLEAINAAQATITSNNSITTWIANARNYIWQNGYTKPGETTPTWYKHNGNYKDFASVAAAKTDYDGIGDAFSTAYIVPYLVVNVTAYNENGTMTATLTPYYRVDISAAPTSAGGTGYSNQIFYTVQSGRALSALTGDMRYPIKVKFAITGAAGTNFSTAYMHQDGKYVYQATGQEWSIYHAGASGLGSVQINLTDGKVSFPASAANAIKNRVPDLPTYKYDTLQAAIDDTVPGLTQPNLLGADTDPTDEQVVETYDTIQVEGDYGGSCTITMTGAARKVRVIALGDLPIKSANQDVDVQNPSGWTYDIQLKRDNVEQPTGEVTISAATATNGSATVSLNKAKAGDSITVTTRPNAGYGVSSLTIRTNTGATVSYQSTATNVYKFTVPQNVTSITVTPAFAVNSVATISITDAANGLATHNATDGKARGGSTVTVTTRPFNGYNATGVSAVTETGSTVPVSRIAENTYTFVVPVTATRVVVTPVFGAANRHPFIDVPDGQWFTDAVSFCYRNNMMKGYGSDYMFSGWSKLTRGELAVILYRLSGEPYSTADSGFLDVSPNEWYAKAVTWASRNGIVTGGDGNKFYPKDVIARQDLAVMLYRYNTYRGGNRGLTGNLSGYFDQSSIDGYAQSAMQWAVGNGIVTGSNNMLMPKGDASRYEAATMLMRYGKNFMGLT